MLIIKCVYNLLYVYSGFRQNVQGAVERARYLPRAIRPHAQAARDHRVGMITYTFVSFVLRQRMYSGSGHTNSLLDNFYNPKCQKFLLENFLLSMRVLCEYYVLSVKKFCSMENYTQEFSNRKE